MSSPHSQARSFSSRSTEHRANNTDDQRHEAQLMLEEHDLALERERVRQHKIEFSAQLDELGLKIYNTVQRIERDVKGMNAERDELQQIHSRLSQHLKILSTLHPSKWSANDLEDKLLLALGKLDRAENDLQEAFVGEKRYRYSEAFSVRPDQAKTWGVTMSHLVDELKRGFFFHLPLIIFTILLIGGWLLISHHI